MIVDATAASPESSARRSRLWLLGGLACLLLFAALANLAHGPAAVSLDALVAAHGAVAIIVLGGISLTSPIYTALGLWSLPNGAGKSTLLATLVDAGQRCRAARDSV